MPITATQKVGTYETAPAGNHVAVCHAVYDLGTQPGFEPGETARKVRICWELSEELMTDGRPFGVSEVYTLSLSEKANLYKMLIAWRGRAFTPEELKGFDLANLLGAPCFVNVVHQPDKKDPKKMWANVSTVSPLPKSVPRPDAINPLVQFAIDDAEIPATCPDFIATKIKASEEWRHRYPAANGAPAARPMSAATASSGPGDSSIPF
jgi:hypothetical protein